MKKNQINFGLGVVGLVILTACGSEIATAPVSVPAVPVTVYKATEETVITVDAYPGIVVALNEVELRAEVGGALTGIFVKDGQKVSKGQKLYEIDRTNYLAAYNSAKASLRVAKANYNKFKKDAERYTNLAKQEAVAKQRVDYALTDLENAASQVAVAEAALATAGANLKRSVILSPLNGTIGISQVKPGALVVQGNTLLNTVSTNDPIAVDISISQQEISRFLDLQRNLAVKDSVFSIVLPDKTLYRSSGKIVAVDRSVDPTTGTLKVRISYPNASGQLVPGMVCKLNVLNRSKARQLTIPYKAVMEQLGENMVYIVGDSSKAQQRLVKLGSKFGDKVVVTEGLKRGDAVVSQGSQNLRSGTPVKVN